ncbi:hypothetical protein A3Q56_07427 [Intoshia linei]|uniref:Uncharacterized protein n=1 Tax=Intoshia linei TaxID=1819745 RepID=A0A177AS96_9BILA|nr:hypothetical protein A3Q56_07427 [Intoshia linei]
MTSIAAKNSPKSFIFSVANKIVIRDFILSCNINFEWIVEDCRITSRQCVDKLYHTFETNACIVNSLENKLKQVQYIESLLLVRANGRTIIWINKYNFNLFCRPKKSKSTVGSRGVTSPTFVIDSAPVHNNIETVVRDDKDVKIIRLAPYSYLLNPIELAWNLLKFKVNDNYMGDDALIVLQDNPVVSSKLVRILNFYKECELKTHRTKQQHYPIGLSSYLDPRSINARIVMWMYIVASNTSNLDRSKIPDNMITDLYKNKELQSMFVWHDCSPVVELWNGAFVLHNCRCTGQNRHDKLLNVKFNSTEAVRQLFFFNKRIKQNDLSHSFSRYLHKPCDLQLLHATDAKLCKCQSININNKIFNSQK